MSQVDTLKKVRMMCSSKALSLADSLESELNRIGLGISSTPAAYLNKLQADLEQARRK